MAASVNFLKYPARAHEMKLAGGIEAFDKVRHLASYKAGYNSRLQKDYKIIPVCIIGGLLAGVTLKCAYDSMADKIEEETTTELEDAVKQELSPKSTHTKGTLPAKRRRIKLTPENIQMILELNEGFSHNAHFGGADIGDKYFFESRHYRIEDKKLMVTKLREDGSSEKSEVANYDDICLFIRQNLDSMKLPEEMD